MISCSLKTLHLDVFEEGRMKWDSHPDKIIPELLEVKENLPLKMKISNWGELLASTTA